MMDFQPPLEGRVALLRSLMLYTKKRGAVLSAVDGEYMVTLHGESLFVESSMRVDPLLQPVYSPDGETPAAFGVVLLPCWWDSAEMGQMIDYYFDNRNKKSVKGPVCIAMPASRIKRLSDLGVLLLDEKLEETDAADKIVVRIVLSKSGRTKATNIALHCGKQRIASTPCVLIPKEEQNN